MTMTRKFCCNDLLRLASLHLDHFTETLDTTFYMAHMVRWANYFHVAEAPGNKIIGYIMGKVEGEKESWHCHVNVVTVAPEYRRQKVATKLMNLLENMSDKTYNAYYVDLFVRADNAAGIKMFENLGYVIYRRRRVTRYYYYCWEGDYWEEDAFGWEEDGLDMRKALSRDVKKKSMIPLKEVLSPMN